MTWLHWAFLQGSHSCGSTLTSINGDKTPLDTDLTNPCNHQTVSNQEFFYVYIKDNSKFIHCDVWGNAWVMDCQDGLIWNQQSHACVEDHSHPDLSNPCTQEMLENGITMFPHPDPHKYIHCDGGLNQWVQSCVPGTVFDFTTQNCVWENANLGWSLICYLMAAFIWLNENLFLNLFYFFLPSIAISFSNSKKAVKLV